MPILQTLSSVHNDGVELWGKFLVELSWRLSLPTPTHYWKGSFLAHKLDLIVVIDIEATCWEKARPKGQENEIIEVGVCTLDVQTGERLHKESILVRPERSKVSPFCTKLTTLTQEQVAKGISFTKACRRLKEKYATKQRVWASYGDYDRTIFAKQCARRKISYPFGETHINIKNMLAVMMGLKREISLAEAMIKLGLKFEGTHHRGHDDAWNAAMILAELMKQTRLSD